MMLGTDVSSLSTTAATAAAQGLSIVVPVYNEAAGLGILHQRLSDLAGTLLGLLWGRVTEGLARQQLVSDQRRIGQTT